MQGLKYRKNRWTYFLLTFPALLLHVVFFAYPVLSGFYYSMTDWNGLNRSFNFIGIQNFLKLFKDSSYMSSAWFTFKYMILIVIFVNCTALLLALLVNTKIPQGHRTFFRSVFFFPAVLSMITVGLIFNEIYYRVIPVIGKALNIGFLSKNILSSPNTAMFGILFVDLWRGVSIPFVMIVAGLQSIPKDIYESAIIDGATPFQQFKNITFPFLIPVLNVTLVLSVKGGLTVFDYIKALTDGGPAGSTQSLGLFIYNRGITDLKYGYSMASSIMLLLGIVVISLIQFKVLSKREVGQL